MRKGKPESKLRWSNSWPVVLSHRASTVSAFGSIFIIIIFFFTVFINTILLVVVIISYSLLRTYHVPSLLYALPVTLR